MKLNYFTIIIAMFSGFTLLYGQTITLGVNSPIVEDGGVSTITATASAAPSGFDITVTIAVNGASTAIGGGTDYSLSSTTITIADGFTTGSGTITSVDDSFLEGDESVVIDFVSADNGYTEFGGVGAQQQTVTITDAEFIELNVTTSPILENGGTTSFSAGISGGGSNKTGGVITVNLDWTAGTSTPASDFSGHPASTTIGIDATSSAGITITSLDDTLLEGDESIGVLISTITGAPTGTGFVGATVTSDITDAETVSLSVNNNPIAENAGTATFTATVNDNGGAGGATVGLSTPGSLTVTLGWTGSSTTGVDYSGSGNISIAHSASTGTVTITAIEDSDYEGDETVIATINAISVGSIGTPSSATSTITDEVITLTQVGSPIAENGGTGTFVATSTVNANADITVTLTWGGSATLATDYTRAAATITILNGFNSGSVLVTGVSDLVLDPSESITAVITGVTKGAVLTSPVTQTITITDDETLTDFINSPINGLTGVSVEPTIIWADQAGDALGYDVYLSTSGSSQTDFESNIFASTVIDPLPIPSIPANTTSFSWEEVHSFIPLSKSTIYYAQVIAHQDPFVDHYSTIYHFTTVPEVTITHTSPNNNGLVYTNTPTVYWYASTVTGTMKYKVQYIRDELLAVSGSAPTEVEWTGAASHTTTSLNQSLSVLSGKKYWWRVIALNSSDEVLSYSTPWSFSVIGGTSVTIYQSWPVGNATVYTNTPTVYWYTDQYPLGVTYTVWYNKLGDTNANLRIDGSDTGAASVSAGSDISKILPTLDPGTKYYWSVHANYNAESAYSGIESFTTNGSGTLSKPILSYPVGGVTVYTSSPSVYWYPSGSFAGIKYKVYYRDKAVGGAYTEATGGTPTSNFYYQLTGLTAGKTYEWYVQAVSGASTLDSDVAEFQVTGGILFGYPVVTWPTGNPTQYTVRPTLNWYLEGSSLGLTGYVVKYSKTDQAGSWDSFSPGAPDASDGEISIGSITTYNYTFAADLTYGATYYWAVASTDGATESAYATGSFTIFGPGSAVAPTLSLPTNTSTIYDRSPTLYWFLNGSTAGFVSYTLVYSISDVFASGATTTVTGITDDFYALSSLTPGATYYWYVTAVYSQGTTSSSTNSFIVDPGALSVQPFIGGPANNVEVSTQSPTLSWAIPVLSQSQLSYRLEVADNEQFESPMIYESIQTPYQNISGLQEGYEYYWRVRSSTYSGDVSYYSGVGKFKVVGSNITDVKDEGIIPTEFMVMQNYPNPFNPVTTINYSLPKSAFVMIKVYDMLGREVKSLLSNEKAAGVHTVNWNGEDNYGSRVSSGTYIYRVVAGDKIAVKKMILLK